MLKHQKNKQITSDILTQLLKETNKVFCLDGDLHNRSLDYLENTIKKEYKYYKNEYKPLKKKIQFTRDLQYFNDEITKKLKENKKIKKIEGALPIPKVVLAVSKASFIKNKNQL